MGEEIREQLERLNELLHQEGVTPFKLALVEIAKCKLLEKNARFMKKEVFDVLVKGIQRQGLSSLPFCYFDGKWYHVLSGNHRVMGAKAAGKKEILILYTDSKMSREEQIAVQLAHNQVTGQDDPQVLKELWREIESLELKEITGFDDQFFKNLEPIEFKPIKDAGIELKSISFTFIQEDIDKIEEAVAALEQRAKDDKTLLASYRDFNIFFDSILQLKEGLGIVNTATAIRKMAEITLDHLASLDT